MSGLGQLVRWWRSHGTRILGSSVVIVAGWLAIPNLIPEEQRPYWGGLNVVLGVLTYRRGKTNSNREQLK